MVSFVSNEYYIVARGRRKFECGNRSRLKREAPPRSVENEKVDFQYSCREIGALNLESEGGPSCAGQVCPPLITGMAILLIHIWNNLILISSACYRMNR